MSFSMRHFLKTGFLNAVGKTPDYQIILNAAGYHEKGLLAEEALAEIQAAIDRKNAPAPDTEEPNDIPDYATEEPDV